MKLRAHFRHFLNPIMGWLVIVAVMLNASVTNGAMLERGADGKVQIVICSAQGTLNAWLDVQTGKIVTEDDEHQPDNTKKSKHCPMGTATQFVDHSTDFTPQFPIRIVQPFCPSAACLPPVIGQSPAKISVRGPPHSV